MGTKRTSAVLPMRRGGWLLAWVSLLGVGCAGSPSAQGEALAPTNTAPGADATATSPMGMSPTQTTPAGSTAATTGPVAGSAASSAGVAGVAGTGAAAAMTASSAGNSATSTDGVPPSASGAAGAAATAGTGAAPDLDDSSQVPSVPDSDFSRTATQLTASLSIGWNAGNSLDAPEGETAWGNPALTPQLFQAVADQGFKVVRIPVTWSMHTGSAPDFDIEPAWLSRVTEVVQMALDRDLYAIINLHHDGADGYDGVEWLSLNDASGAISADNNMRVEARFVALWKQIAGHFADRGERLIFESMNEIHDGYGEPKPEYYEIINHLNQVFVDTVRASGGHNDKRYLLVPGYNTNIDYTLAGFKAPTDPTPQHLLLSIHYYDPWDFAGEGKTATWGAASPSNDGWGQEDYVRKQFDQLQAKFVQQGIPVIIGEYGAVRATGDQKYRRYYMEYVTKAAVERGLLPVYWDNGGEGAGKDGFGLFSRSSGAVLDADIIKVMMHAAQDDYPLSAVAPP